MPVFRREWPFWVVGLGLFPACNLISGRMSPSGAYAAYMLCVAICEELFFRGWLISRISMLGTIPAVMISSLVFGLLHILNQGRIDLQVICALGAGLCYCGVRLRSKSILLPVAFHFLTNLTGASVAEIPLLICAVISAMVGMGLCGRYAQEEKYGKPDCQPGEMLFK
jgi:membrane protease YdiL (CAAX protease family)